MHSADRIKNHLTLIGDELGVMERRAQGQEQIVAALVKQRDDALDKLANAQRNFDHLVEAKDKIVRQRDAAHAEAWRLRATCLETGKLRVERDDLEKQCAKHISTEKQEREARVALSHLVSAQSSEIARLQAEVKKLRDNPMFRVKPAVAHVVCVDKEYVLSRGESVDLRVEIAFDGDAPKSWYVGSVKVLD